MAKVCIITNPFFNCPHIVLIIFVPLIIGACFCPKQDNILAVIELMFKNE